MAVSARPRWDERHAFRPRQNPAIVMGSPTTGRSQATIPMMPRMSAAPVNPASSGKPSDRTGFAPIASRNVPTARPRAHRHRRTRSRPGNCQERLRSEMRSSPRPQPSRHTLHNCLENGTLSVAPGSQASAAPSRRIPRRHAILGLGYRRAQLGMNMAAHSTALLRCSPRGRMG